MRRVYFIGLRGFPGVAGGVETHVENLVFHLQDADLEIVCFGRRRFRHSNKPRRNFEWKWIWAPRTRGIETFIHTFLCALALAFNKRGIVHIHGIGPGALAPLLRLLGFRVVLTHHGFNYLHEKWGQITTLILKFAEFIAVTFAHEIIAVSRNVRAQLESRFNRTVHYVPNGIPANNIETSCCNIDFPESSLPFFMMASRVVPEKRIHDVLAAFSRLNRNNVRLLIAGSADEHGESYEDNLRKQTTKGLNIEFIGFLQPAVLWRYMDNCLAFINSSSHEGLPIAVLEAAAHGAKLILSDIPAHREFELPSSAYFDVGDIDALAKLMQMVLSTDETTAGWRINDTKMREYSWDRISMQTLQIYLA